MSGGGGGRGIAAALAVLLAGCAAGPQRREDAVDPAVYATCQDAEGEAAWTRARAALARGDDAAALPDLQLAVRQCPLLVRAHLAYQDAARRAGGATAQAMVDYYTGLAGTSPVPAYCRARLADTSYAQANALQRILADDPSFAWAHLSLARVTRRQGRLLPAVDMYQLAIVNDPQLHEARRERAQVLAELGREAEAANDYQAYLAAQPDDAGAMRDFASLLLYRLDRAADAIPLLTTLEAKQPGDVGLRIDRAAALWRTNRPREAVDAYLAILRDVPGNTRAALNIGLLYYEVAPRNEAERARYWPRARAAFRWFLQGGEAADGHEQFERTLGVPFRLDRIAKLLGPEPPGAVQLDDLRWPASG
jgi:tetratricopeptide (TPR) repeat protein